MSMCPVYSLSIANDGLASFVGRHAERQGRFGAHIPFSELADWIDGQPSLMSGSEDVPIAVDGERVTLTIFLKDGKAIVKKFGTGSGRPDLWAAAEVLDGLAAKVQWEKSNIQ